MHIAAPYLFLTVLVALLVIPPVNRILSAFEVGLPLTDGTGAHVLYSPVRPLTHSGTLLLAMGAFAFVYYRRNGHIPAGKFAQMAKNALSKSGKAIIPILFLILMSKIMDGTGQIHLLSSQLAAALGAVYPLCAPFIGILGAFVSSSNMSSNILFAGFQRNAALQLGVSESVILAAQTAGGSVGNLLATSNIVLGLATTGEIGKEGLILRKLLPICLISGAACGVIALLLV